MKQKKLLVIGGYGIGNIGDEAMLSVIADRFSNYKITALTYSIKETEIMHNIQGISMGGALLTFPFYDKILIGGGTIFRGGLRRRVKLLPFLLYLVQIILRKKVLYYGIGIDGDIPDFCKFFLVRSMSKAEGVMVRDKASKELLEDWGLKKKISLEHDLAFDLEPASKNKAKAFLSDEGANIKKKKIGISICRAIEQSKIAEIINSNQNIEFIFFPFCKHKFNAKENDLNFVGGIDEKNFKILKGDYSPEEFLEMVGLMNGFIAMRFHSIVFCEKMKVPYLAISYAEKCESFLRERRKDFMIYPGISYLKLKRWVTGNMR